MIEPFSNGYYLGHFHVYPAEGDIAEMAAIDYEVLQDFYTGDGPLVMKLSTSHFQVTHDEEVPLRSLAVPEPILDEAGLDRTPKETEVLVARDQRVANVLGF